MQFDTITIRKLLKKKLDPSRYEHTLGVAYTAMSLAMRYESDLYKAEVAGLLHDCAKCLSDETKIKKCEKYNINMNSYERRNPSMLHAKLGAYLAIHKYEVTDNEIIRAILCHTTGKPAMTMLEKIIFVADYIEPRRNKAPNLSYIRRLSFENIDKAVCEIMSDTIAYLRKNVRDMDETTISAYNYYKNLIAYQND